MTSTVEVRMVSHLKGCAIVSVAPSPHQNKHPGRKEYFRELEELQGYLVIHFYQT
jgi:hypothetical protein